MGFPIIAWAAAQVVSAFMRSFLGCSKALWNVVTGSISEVDVGNLNGEKICFKPVVQRKLIRVTGPCTKWHAWKEGILNSVLSEGTKQLQVACVCSVRMMYCALCANQFHKLLSHCGSGIGLNDVHVSNRVEAWCPCDLQQTDILTVGQQGQRKRLVAQVHTSIARYWAQI